MINFFRKLFIRLFYNRKKYIEHCIGLGGVIVLEDKTVVVRQSREFHNYCYGVVYNKWEEIKSKDMEYSCAELIDAECVTYNGRSLQDFLDTISDKNC